MSAPRRHLPAAAIAAAADTLSEISDEHGELITWSDATRALEAALPHLVLAQLDLSAHLALGRVQALLDIPGPIDPERLRSALG